jgi:hypothetical protein
VEPFTNYALARARRTTRGGRYTWGVIGTSVIRRFGAGDDALRDRVPSHAETVGADWNLYSAGQKYRLMGNFALSNVQGDSLAIGGCSAPARATSTARTG